MSDTPSRTTASSTDPSPGSNSPGSPANAPAGLIRRYLREAPVSVGLAVILLITSVVTGTLWSPANVGGDSLVWSAGTIPFGAGWWWTPVTALFVPNDPIQLVISLLAVLVLFAVAERLLGHVRAALSFLVTGVLGILIGLGLQSAALAVGEQWATDTDFSFTLDPTIGVAGALITASAMTRVLWRRRIRILTFAVVIMFVLYNGDQDNFYRLIAALLGLPLGVLLRRDRQVLPWRRSSHRETRTLVALITAITAVGPLASLIPPGGSGPLSIIAAAFNVSAGSGADLLDSCRATVSAVCDRRLELVASAGVGPALLSLAPLALLLVAAVGLRRGRRFAWLVAVITNTALAVLAFLGLGLGDVLDPATRAVLGWEFTGWLLASIVVPAGVVALLLVTRRNFQIRAPRRAVRTFTATVLGAWAVLLVVYLVTGWLTLGSFIPGATAAQIAVDGIRRFLPTGFWSSFGPIILPEHGFALLLYDWIGVVFWVIAIVAILRLYGARDDERTQTQEERFRQLLKAGGGGTLGFMGTWPGNVYWFTPSGDGAVAYRVINGIAIALSDPVCRPEDADATVDGFVDFCEQQGWTPVFYSFHGPFLPIFERFGWQHMSVGEETLMNPRTLDMAGKPWQKIRQALNKGTKAGITTLWTTWDELPAALSAQITAISEQWVAEKELPEMGFTLGAMDELKDPEVRLFIAMDPDGRMQAITSWLPSYTDGRVSGWTIDFMRRGDESMPGIMEFVIASAALRMQTEGVKVLSLSGAPLASKPLAPGETPPATTAMSSILDFLARTLEPAYGFSSLFKFKSKFNPAYETIHLAYPDPAGLPAIGAAIGKAYLPEASAKEYVALARTLRK